MSKVSITRSLLDDLAVSISLKSGEPVPMTLAEMKDAVDDIHSGTTVEALSVTQNGTYTAPSGTAYSPVTVSVPAPTPTLQTKTVSYTPTESAQSETVTADSGYDGLSQVSVSVGAISSTYVGSGITRRTSSDLTANGATVTVPSGYYAGSASKSVASGSLVSDISGTDEPSITVSSSGLVQVDAGYSATVSPVSSSGWIDSSATTEVEIALGGTYQLSTQGAATITPSTSSQTAVAAGKYTTGAVTVAAMPTGTAGTPTATKGTVSNHSVTVTPSVTNSTGWITGSTKSGTGVSVSASELVSGSETKSSNGTYDVTNLASLVVAIPIQHYYTGSSAPSSSLGQNGDIYLQT